MTSDAVIKIEHVSKKYCRALKHTMSYGISDIARNSIGLSANSGRLRDGEFWALDDVSFEIKRGETVGIIGSNGSGKSTLLKLLNGIFMPDRGRIEIKGRVGALIEVGAGFHPMLTGRENIYVNAAILGMGKKEIDKKLDEIVDFADIGDFIDSPVKHYSSGMYVRLGFAVAVHTEPDILLMDEILAVGDSKFRMKCIEKIKNLQKQGVTVIFVTHEMLMVKKTCQRCLWLNAGNLEMIGNPNEVVDRCVDYIKNKGHDSAVQSVTAGEAVRIIKIWTEGFDGKERDDFEFGETVAVSVQYNCSCKMEKLIFGIALFTNDNVCISALHTGLDGVKLRVHAGINHLRIDYPSINLLGGTYYFDIGFFEDTAVAPFAYISRAHKINITAPFLADGILVMEHKWQDS